MNEENNSNKLSEMILRWGSSLVKGSADQNTTSTEENNNTQQPIPTGYNSQLIQEALRYGDMAVRQRNAAAQNTLGAAEAGMYDMLGRMQLQTERDIADRRMRALRTGQTSSGLAAMEMQNIMAGQIGAQQIMADSRNQRMLMEQELAGTEANNRYYMLEMLNQNMKDMAAIDAQKYSASMLPGLQELFPDADPQTLMLLVRSMTPGQELSASERQALKNYQAGIHTTAEWNDYGDAEAFYNGNQNEIDAILSKESSRDAKLDALQESYGLTRAQAKQVYRQSK